MEENASQTEKTPDFAENLDSPPGTTPYSDTNKPEEPPDTDPHFDFGNIFRDIDNFILTHDRSKSGGTSPEKEEVPESVAKFLNLVEGIVIGRCDSGDERWNEVPEGDALFLESVDRITKLVKILAGSSGASSNSPNLLNNRIGKIQQQAMLFLEEQLRLILEESYSSKSNPEPKVEEDHDQDPAEEAEPEPDPEPYPDYPNDVVSSVRSIAARMLSAGYEAECCNAYKIGRQNALDDAVYKTMGFERIAIDDMQKMPWEALERDISTWISTCKQCVVVYFPGELKLIHEVFTTHHAPRIAPSLYRALLRTVFIHLINFAEAVAMLKRTTEKLFKTLDMYETMRDTILSTDDSLLFPHDSTRPLRAEAAAARSRLGEAAISIFFELDNSIRSETGKTAVPGGAVHPLTRYTMNYLSYACQYKDTLEQVFADHAKFERADSTSRPCHGDDDKESKNHDQEYSRSPMGSEMVKIMKMLEANLEGKSKLYKDVALSSIFMMNNGQYMLQKIQKSPEMHQVMGGTWSRKMYAEMMNHHRTYQRETWNKLLGCLGHEGLMNNGKVVKPVLKERFKSFSSMFEEIHKTQSTWVVSDEQLQTELRISISSLVVPAYRSFMGRFSQYLDPGKQYQKYIKFQPDDLETHIDDLFEGNAKKR